jgi:hypothetical protein
MDPLKLNIVKPYVKPKLRIVTGNDPPAGQEWSVTVPTGKVWELLSVEATLVTDATAVTRFPRLVLDDGTTEFYRWQAPSAGASNNAVYVWAATGAGQDAGNSGKHGMIPPNVVLLPGWRVRSFTASLQTGDNWGAPVLYVVEYEAF